MARPLTKHESLVHRLLSQNKLPDALARLTIERKYGQATDLVNAYYYILREQDIKLRDNTHARYAAKKKGYDDLWQALQKIPDSVSQNERLAFLCICFSSMGLTTAPYTYSAEEFEKEFCKTEESRAEYQPEYDVFAQHPLMIAIRDGLRYLPRQDALSVMHNLWSYRDLTSFLFVYDVLAGLQNRAQRKIDPQFTEDSFDDSIASFEGLELVIKTVPRGTGRGNSLVMADMPPMRVLVSNVPKPIENLNGDDRASGDETRPWAGLEQPGFYIVTTRKTYTDLLSYMRVALRNRNGSRGYGPYRYTSNDTHDYPSAANLIAVLHDELKTPKNMTVHAQQRMRDQLETLLTASLSKTYAYRFLRTQNMQPWSEALNLSFLRRRRQDWDGMSFREAGRQLVLHGFSEASDFLAQFADTGTLEEIENGSAQSIQAYQGTMDGILELRDHMKDLCESSDVMTPSLDWYEQTRGFHPDLRDLSVLERRQLAFRDVSDLMIAAITGLQINLKPRTKLKGNLFADIQAMIDDARAKRERGDSITSEEYRISEEYGEAILSQIPDKDIMDLFLKAGDVTNAMRLLKARALFKEKDDPDSVSRQLGLRIQKAGYHVMDDMVIKGMNKLKFESVIRHDGTVFICTEHMVDFRTADQIVDDGDSFNAIALKTVLEGIDFPETMAAAQSTQVEALNQFLEQHFRTVGMKEGLSSLLKNIPAEAHKTYLDLLRNALPLAVAAALEQEGTLTPDNFKKELGKSQKAFGDATAARTPFAHVTRAVNAVRGLFDRRKKQDGQTNSIK